MWKAALQLTSTVSTGKIWIGAEKEMVFDSAFLARVFPRLSLMSLLILKEPILGRLELVRLRFGALQSLA
jgi:hypothetical protein